MQTTQLARIGLVAAAVVLAIIIGLATARPAEGQPPVQWLDNGPLQVEVVAGTTTVVIADFTAHKDLTAPGADPSELPEFFVMNPPTLPDMPKNQEGTVILNAAVPSETQQGTVLEGRVKLRKNAATSAYPLFLDIEATVVWPNMESPEGWSVSFPPNLVADVQDPIAVSGLPMQNAAFTQAGSPNDGPGFTLEWDESYIAGTPLTVWADSVNWPAANGDWRNIYGLTTIDGREALQDASDGSVILVVGTRLYHVTNGIGFGPTSLPLDTFNEILDSLEFTL